MALFSRPHQMVPVQPSTRPTPWMQRLQVLCPPNEVHPFPSPMICIGTVSDPRSSDGMQCIYADPYGRGTPHACHRRCGIILDRRGKAFVLWEGIHQDGRR